MKGTIIAITIISISVFILKVGAEALSDAKKEHSKKKRAKTWNNQIAVFFVDWGNVNINENLALPKKDITDWSYPWYMIKHKDGHFENTLGDKIKAKDTTKIHHQSYCYSLVDDDTISRLKFSKAQQIREKVFIKLYDQSASNHESLTLEMIDFKKFNPTYKINYVFPYDSIGIKFLRKELEIKEEIYQKGGTLIGRIDLELEQKIYKEVNDNQKVTTTIKRLEGIFEVEIE